SGGQICSGARPLLRLTPGWGMWSEGHEAERTGPRRSLTVAGAVHRRQRTVLTVIPLSAVQPNPEQPRKHFAEDALADLAAAILERGLLQPVVVRRHGSGYQLLAGERRCRGGRPAGGRPDAPGAGGGGGGPWASLWWEP